MAESPQPIATQVETPSPTPLDWTSNRSKRKKKKKDAAYVTNTRTTLESNELLTIPEALNTVISKPISLLTTDVKTHKLIGVSREVMEKALKCLKTAPKILAKLSNAMSEVLLATEEEAK